MAASAIACSGRQQQQTLAGLLLHPCSSAAHACSPYTSTHRTSRAHNPHTDFARVALHAVHTLQVVNQRAFANNCGVPIGALMDFKSGPDLRLRQVHRPPARCQGCAGFINVYCKVLLGTGCFEAVHVLQGTGCWGCTCTAKYLVLACTCMGLVPFNALLCTARQGASGIFGGVIGVASLQPRTWALEAAAPSAKLRLYLVMGSWRVPG